MDYKTKPIDRKELRAIAKWVRSAFRSKNKLRFDVVKAFEKINSIFFQITTEIITDYAVDIISDLNVPAACIPDMKGNYHIVVRESIYDGACQGIGGYRAHILHEMSHAILCLLGYVPTLNREFKNNEIKPCYESMEWQAKALTGEILIPYEHTIGMSEKKIVAYCQVSKASAQYRINNLDKDEQYDFDPNDYKFKKLL